MPEANCLWNCSHFSFPFVTSVDNLTVVRVPASKTSCILLASASEVACRMMMFSNSSWSNSSSTPPASKTRKGISFVCKHKIYLKMALVWRGDFNTNLTPKTILAIAPNCKFTAVHAKNSAVAFVQSSAKSHQYNFCWQLLENNISIQLCLSVKDGIDLGIRSTVAAYCSFSNHIGHIVNVGT